MNGRLISVRWRFHGWDTCCLTPTLIAAVSIVSLSVVVFVLVVLACSRSLARVMTNGNKHASVTKAKACGSLRLVMGVPRIVPVIGE